MKRIFRKIADSYSQYGLMGFIARMMSVLTFRKFIVVDHIIMHKSLDRLKEYTPPKKLRILPLEECNILMFKEFCKNNDCTLKDAKILNSILKNNLKGFVATINQEMIGYIWWTDNQIPLIDNHPHLIRYGLNLRDDDVYTFDFFIINKYRGSGNAVEFLTTVEFRLKDLGFRKVYGQVSVDNKPARWLYKLIGYEEGRIVTNYIIFKLILITNNRVFIRNNELYSSYCFDYRPLFHHSLLKSVS